MKKFLRGVARLWQKYEEVRPVAEETAAVGAFLVDESEAADLVTAIGIASDHLERYEPEGPCPGCGAEPATSCAEGCPDAARAAREAQADDEENE